MTLILLVLNLLSVYMQPGSQEIKDKGIQVAKRFVSTEEPERYINYLLYLPENYSKNNGSVYPILIFLHGAGERGNNLEMLKRNGPPMLIEAGKSFPMIIVSPQCPEGRTWDIELLYLMIRDILKKYEVDKNRIYLSGLSMGGFGTWDLAYVHPELFAALIPICGGANAYKAEKIKNIPIWAFHGAQDNIVPVSRSQEIVDAIKNAGGNVKFTIYPETGHDSWTETYNNPEVFQWLLNQSK